MKRKLFYLLVALLTLAGFLPGAILNGLPALAEAAPPFLSKWGSGGSGDGEFNWPWGVAVDASGNVYVADSIGSRIQKFTSSGSFITQWGTYGSGDGQFSAPSGVAVDISGNVYVADSIGSRIQKFTSSGSFITKWGVGSGDDPFIYPYGVATDALGNVYVAEAGNHLIQKFTSSGSFITQWGTYGTGDGQFLAPYGLAVDASGNVYVADTGHYPANSDIRFDSIQKFTNSGVFITRWGSAGSGDGQLNNPMGLAVDASGDVYVVEMGNNRIQKFTSSGSFITKWGSFGSGDGQFFFPMGVAVDALGNVYVADSFNNRIQVFGYLTPIETYTLTVNVAGNGSVTRSPDQANYDQGTPVQLTATPAPGYHFTDWSGDLSGSTNPATIIMNSNKIVTATFAINTYTINASAGANGSITPSGAVSVNYGDDQTFAIAPNTGCHIADVVVDGSSVGAVSSYTFSNVNANHTIAASFALNGIVDIDPDTLNLKSQSDKNAITVYIELPSGFDVKQIDIASVKIEGTSIGAQPSPTAVGDYDADKVPDLMVKLDRQAVIAFLDGKTGDITLTIIGQLTGSGTFTGSDTIKVINPVK